MKVIYRMSDKGYPKQKLALVNNENCFKNFCKNFLGRDLSNLVLIYDNCSPVTTEKINAIIKDLNLGRCPVTLNTNAGNAGSYLIALEYALKNFGDDDIVYFVENDFIHDTLSDFILMEGYNLLGTQADYVTLYAHPDKEMPDNIQPEYIFRSKSCYWRTCISTVMTCSAKVKTLREDFDILTKWTKGAHPEDHSMYSELRQKGRLLISPMPGYATHGETKWLSPFKNWDKILSESAGEISGMNIIQIGANDGEDHVYDFINKNSSKINKLILVEPMPQLIPVLKSRYSKLLNSVEYENTAISGNESDSPLKFYYEINSNLEASTFNKNHLLSLGCMEDKIASIDVPVLTFDQLMKKHNLVELDALYIDTEGHDYHIIKSIDFKKYKIKLIVFESMHTDGTNFASKNMNDLIKYFEENNYHFNAGTPNSSATLKV
jgi:FkbM family methyltransferase